MTTPPRRPEGRYDEPRRLPRQLLVVLAALLGILALTVAYAAYRDISGRSTHATVLSADVRSDREVVVRLEVRYDRGADARCEVVAYDRDRITVGHHTLRLVRGLGSPTVTSVSLRTSARAFAVKVTGCAP